MIIIQEPQISIYSPCSYLSDKEWRFEYFFAMDVNYKEFNDLLKNGWRKFGAYFFRPNCEDCTKCIPIRILTKEFKLTKNHKRIIKKGSKIDVKFVPLRYRDDIYEIYCDHSLNRFGKESDKSDFIHNFYTQSCPSLQSEYYLDNELIAVGFLDMSIESLSSVYFIYKTEYDVYSLGIYSIIKEIEYAASLNLKYYYLGYYIEENQSMAYKNRFHPNEKYNWIDKRWFRTDHT